VIVSALTVTRTAEKSRPVRQIGLIEWGLAKGAEE
jgi:hypothetical protein